MISSEVFPPIREEAGQCFLRDADMQETIPSFTLVASIQVLVDIDQSDKDVPGHSRRLIREALEHRLGLHRSEAARNICGTPIVMNPILQEAWHLPTRRACSGTEVASTQDKSCFKVVGSIEGIR